MSAVTGRFAPSPSGRLHLGNLACSLLAWLSARSQGGRIVLRIEDLDAERCPRKYADALEEDLRWLGLVWDEGGSSGGPNGPYYQSECAAIYTESYNKLEAQGLVYPCFCSRAQLHAASAPHTSDGNVIYPGTCRGTMLRLSGEEANVAAAVRAVEGMLLLIENHTPLEDQTVRYCLSLAHDGKEQRVRELTEDFVTVTVKGRPIRPKTLGQKEYLNAIRKNAVTFGVGPAGTGKTYLAVAMAVKAFKAKDVSRIVLTRPAVEAGEKLGFLPGDLQQKVDPYLRPLYDGLFDMLGAETYERLVEKQIIEVAPLAYMRGRTLDDSFIILDEAQNTTPEQMKMFLTRMGVGSKVVVTGDVTQIDLPDRTRSGLVDALHILKNVDGIAQCYFTEKDVVRHRLVQEIIKAYEAAAHPAKR